MNQGDVLRDYIESLMDDLGLLEEIGRIGTVAKVAEESFVERMSDAQEFIEEGSEPSILLAFRYLREIAEKVSNKVEIPIIEGVGRF
jgi:hypothetical protein